MIIDMYKGVTAYGLLFYPLGEIMPTKAVRGKALKYLKYLK